MAYHTTYSYEEQLAGTSFGYNAAKKNDDELFYEGPSRVLKFHVSTKNIRTRKKQYHRERFTRLHCKPEQTKCPTKSRRLERSQLTEKKVAKKVKNPFQSVYERFIHALSELQTKRQQKKYYCSVEPACHWSGRQSRIHPHIMRAHSESLLFGTQHELKIKLENRNKPTRLHNWVVYALGEFFHVNLEIRQGESGQVLGCVIFLGQSHRALDFKYIFMVGPNADDTTRRCLTFSRATHSYVDSCSLHYMLGDCLDLQTDIARRFSVRPSNILKVQLRIEAVGNHQ